ncbi:MAG: D-aminoacyl-tRNA deacylase [Butyricicoccus sp.]
MRAIIQRVSHASVTIDGAVRGKIGPGLLILLGVSEDDTEENALYLADKCTGLRIFTDEDDKMNRSAADIGGSLLVISQFTLYGDCRRGKRPSFVRAARPEKAIPLYEAFLARCRASGLPVETGEFGADMKVELLNDGPVTIVMDTEEMKKDRR